MHKDFLKEVNRKYYRHKRTYLTVRAVESSSAVTLVASDLFPTSSIVLAGNTFALISI